jgi:hypothetical protein
MWVLERIVLVVYAYGLARDRGEKYSVAIYEAVKYIRENVPAMRISETEVRRILAAWRPKRSPSCLVVRKSQTTECQRRLLRGRKFSRCYTVSVEQRPIYPRANAAKKLTPSTSSPMSL